jgi:hypothetical protein
MPKGEAIFVMVFSMLRVSEPRKQSVFFKSTFSPCIVQPPAGEILLYGFLSHSHPYNSVILYRNPSLCEYHSYAVLLFTPEFSHGCFIGGILRKWKNLT